MPRISAISSGVGTGLLITICSMNLVYDEWCFPRCENSPSDLAGAGGGGVEPKGHGDSVTARSSNDCGSRLVCHALQRSSNLVGRERSFLLNCEV
jgi:hypothetical protein